eukprot:m.60477 g.60477  ORF g.60477 m.60477 type:complete len:450 (-) comp17448_c0_seq1:451-1800(-)
MWPQIDVVTGWMCACVLAAAGGRGGSNGRRRGGGDDGRRGGRPRAGDRTNRPRVPRAARCARAPDRLSPDALPTTPGPESIPCRLPIRGARGRGDWRDDVRSPPRPRPSRGEGAAVHLSRRDGTARDSDSAWDVPERGRPRRVCQTAICGRAASPGHILQPRCCTVARTAVGNRAGVVACFGVAPSRTPGGQMLPRPPEAARRVAGRCQGGSRSSSPESRTEGRSAGVLRAGFASPARQRQRSGRARGSADHQRRVRLPSVVRHGGLFLTARHVTLTGFNSPRGVGRFDNAVEDLREAIRINPKHPDALRYLETTLLRRAKRCSFHRKWTMALDDYVAAVKLNGPKNAECRAGAVQVERELAKRLNSDSALASARAAFGSSASVGGAPRSGGAADPVANSSSFGSALTLMERLAEEEVSQKKSRKSKKKKKKHDRSPRESKRQRKDRDS